MAGGHAVPAEIPVAIANISNFNRENLQNNCKIYCDNATITVPEPWLPSSSTHIEIETKSRYYKEIIKSKLDSYASQLNLVSNVFKGKLNSENYLVDIDESFKISKTTCRRFIDLKFRNLKF